MTLQKQKVMAAGLVALYLALLLWQMTHYVRSTVPLSAHGATEEQILEFTAARNFVRFGFLKSLLLPDYATSPDPEDHPIYYTHMPSGPSVFLGILLKQGLDILDARYIAITLSALGLVFAYLFFSTLFGSPWPALIGVIGASCSYNGFLTWSDHFVHSFHWLSIFGTAYFYYQYLLGGARRNFFLSIAFFALGLSTSLIAVVTIVLLAAGLSFIVQKRDARSTFAFMSILGFGILFVAGLLVRNMIVLGADVALKEIFYTITNRIAGYPPRSELKEFFQSHNIALWGSNGYNSKALSDWMTDVFRPMRSPINVLIATTAYFYFSDSPRFGRIFEILKKTGVSMVAVAGWYIIFSAHGQNYTLPFIGKMLWAIMLMGATSALMLFISHAREIDWRKVWAARPIPKPIQLVALLTVALSIAVWDNFRGSVRKGMKEFKIQRDAGYEMDRVKSFAALNSLRNETIWTNINSITVNFFSDSKVIGTCSNKAILSMDIDNCFAILISDFKDKVAKLSQPTYVFISELFTSSEVFSFDPEIMDQFRKELEGRATVEKATKDWTLYKINPVSEAKR